MKKLSVIALFATSLLISCSNTKDEKSKAKDDDKIVKEDDNKDKEDDDNVDNSDLGKAAAAYCDCFNENVNDANPRVKKIMMKAADSDNPVMAIQQEMMKIEDEQERAELAQEFEQWGNNKEMEECSDKVKAKYDIKEGDTKTQKAVLKILEDKGDCTFLAAMLRMAMKMKGNTKMNDNVPDMEE